MTPPRRLPPVLMRIGLLLLLMLPARADAHELPGAGGHDLPGRLDVRLMVKPAGDRLHVIARVPLALLEGQALPKRGADLLDLGRLDEPLRRSALAVARTFVFFEGGDRLSPEQGTWRISQPSAPRFDDFAAAEAHLLGPALPESTDVVWNDGWFDLYFLYPIGSPTSAFSLAPQLKGLGGVVTLEVDFVPEGGPVRVHDVKPEDGMITLNAGAT